MNIEFANRLVELRKKNGYSQEELAIKLNVSRQAVSKWERAEASPDTDNLIALASIYNISLDELVNGKKEENEKENNVDDTILHIKEGNEEVKISKDKIIINDNDDSVIINNNDTITINGKDKSKNHLIKHVIDCIAVFLSIVVYLILGFILKDGFRNYWPILFLIIIVPSIYDAIRKHKFCDFAYVIVIVMIYTFIGMLTGLWHPYWVLFITVPVYYVIFGFVDKLIKR